LASDVPSLVAMVERHEGAASARIAERWLATHLDGVLVFRDGQSEPAGFLATFGLDSQADGDPAAAAALAYLSRNAPLRPGESATLFRFWMGRDSYQAVSPVQSLIFVNVIRHYLTRPGLAFSFFPCSEPEFWAPVFLYADARRLQQADFEVEGRAYGVYGHDWRVTPPMAWLDLLAERELNAGPSTGELVTEGEPLLVLSEPAFTRAVHDALRDYASPALLRESPLLRSRVVVDRCGRGSDRAERVSALQDLILEAARTLETAPRQARGWRALQRTYFEPAETQEKAAELLDLPFSTYRRHLGEGIKAVTSILWTREVGA
jgi:hypothetical protein